MKAKDILNRLVLDAELNLQDGFRDETPIQVNETIALLQAEIDKCLPDKYSLHNDASYMNGYNQAIDEARHRLREFIGTDKENTE